MEDFKTQLEELQEKASAADKIENLTETIESLEAQVKTLQAKRDELEEETKVPTDTREYETMAYREIRDLKREIAEIKANTAPARITKEEILAIPDRKKRLQAIRENMDLFEKPQDTTIDPMVKSELSRLGITDAKLDKMTLNDAQEIKNTKTRLYVIEQLLRRA